jgi:hypothetical protein
LFISIPARSGLDLSAHKVRLGEVDHFIAAPAQYSASHLEAKAKGLFETDGRRHRELLPIDQHLYQGRAIVRQRFGQGRGGVPPVFARERQKYRLTPPASQNSD